MVRLTEESRGRPRTFDETEVLNNSIPIFLKHGFFGISISELLDAIGMERSSFYLAFGDKESFYCQVLDCYHQRAFGDMKSFLDNESDFVTGFDQVIDYFYENSTRDKFNYGCLTANAATEIEVKNTKINHTVQTIRNQMVDLFDQRLKRGIRDGQISPSIDTKASAQFLKCCLDGMAVHARGHRDLESIGQIRDNIRQIIRGYRIAG